MHATFDPKPKDQSETRKQLVERLKLKEQKNPENVVNPSPSEPENQGGHTYAECNCGTHLHNIDCAGPKK